MGTKMEYTLSNIIRENRSRNYRTAKEYWSEYQDALQVSYPHYASVEAGTKFPDIHLTINIAKTLSIDLRLACHCWAKDQMPDASSKAFFEPIPGMEIKGIPATMNFPLDDFYVFTELQSQALIENPEIWKILTFIMAFTDSIPPTEHQLIEVLNLEEDIVRDAIDWLRNEGLVISEKGVFKTRRSFFHLPNTSSFRKVRDQNFVKLSQEITSKITPDQLADKTAYRTTFMRRVSKEQAKEISQHIDSLVGHLGNMDNHGSDFYALTVGFGSIAQFNREEI